MKQLPIESYGATSRSTVSYSEYYSSHYMLAIVYPQILANEGPLTKLDSYNIESPGAWLLVPSQQQQQQELRIHIIWPTATILLANSRLLFSILALCTILYLLIRQLRESFFFKVESSSSTLLGKEKKNNREKSIASLSYHLLFLVVRVVNFVVVVCCV